MADQEDAPFCASCFIYFTDDREEAEMLLHNDPYYRDGLYAETHLRRFRPAAGRWVGGVTW